MECMNQLVRKFFSMPPNFDVSYLASNLGTLQNFLYFEHPVFEMYCVLCWINSIFAFLSNFKITCTFSITHYIVNPLRVCFVQNIQLLFHKLLIQKNFNFRFQAFDNFITPYLVISYKLYILYINLFLSWCVINLLV